MSQFSGWEPTAYERVALVSYSTSWPGAAVAGVVAVKVASGTLVVGTAVVGTVPVGMVPVATVGAGDVAAGAATRVREPVGGELTAEG